MRFKQFIKGESETALTYNKVELRQFGKELIETVLPH